MKKYLNPTMNIDKFDVENIVTTSQITATAVQQATTALTGVSVPSENVLVME